MASPVSLPAARLLVVDDIPENRDLLVRRLQRQGHSLIATACDGVEALEAIRTALMSGDPFDAVLLDVMMPRMSGVEVLEAMRAEPALAATPVIMISAATELDTVVRCIELGAEDYLPKPFNPFCCAPALAPCWRRSGCATRSAGSSTAWNANSPRPAASSSACCPTSFPNPTRPIRWRSTLSCIRPGRWAAICMIVS